MLLNSTNLSKSFSFGMLLINERLSLIPPSHGGWFFGLLLSRSLFVYIKWVISQNLESPSYNTKEFDANGNIIDKKNKVDELYKKIEQLKNKINNEKQFNKKVELNLELQKLNKEMEELIDGTREIKD